QLRRRQRAGCGITRPEPVRRRQSDAYGRSDSSQLVLSGGARQSDRLPREPPVSSRSDARGTAVQYLQPDQRERCRVADDAVRDGVAERDWRIAATHGEVRSADRLLGNEALAQGDTTSHCVGANAFSRSLIAPCLSLLVECRF